MKKSLLLLATMLCSVVGFAQWTAPVPSATVDMADDGATTQYLYNKDAGAFLAGHNDWNTRASVADKGDPVRMNKLTGTWNLGIYPSVYADKNAWLYVSCNSYDKLWVDASNATANDDYPGTDGWIVEKQSNGAYKFKNTEYDTGTLGVAEIYNGEKGNTRLYIYVPSATYTYVENDEEIVANSFEGAFYDEWVFITEEEYETFQPKVAAYFAAAAYKAALDAAKTTNPSYDYSKLDAVYNNTSSAVEDFDAATEILNAVLALKKTLDEAEGFGLDVSDSKSVYSNTSATVEELQAATEAAQKKINDYKESAATPDNPQDLTDAYIPDGDFDSNPGPGVWKETTGGQNFQTNGTPGKFNDDTYFLEIWDANPFTGKLYVALTGLPNGVYQFSMSVASNGGEASYVYAGTDSVEVTSNNMAPYSVFTRVENGELEVGLSMPNAVQNWIGIDDVKLIYLGNTAASYNFWVKTNIENAPKYTDEDFVQKDALAEYNKVLATDVSVYTTAEDVLAFNDVLNAAIAKMKENADAYAKYESLIAEAEALQEAGYEGEEADELYDYLIDPAGMEKIKTEKSLSTEEMLAECDKISAMIDVVKANCLAEGMDCTNLLTNPNFDNRLNGWEYDTSLGTPAWGGLDSNPNVERWNQNFNFYQTVANVPNGVYELKVQAFYRPTGSTTGSYNNYIEDPTMDEILTFIYLNASEAPVKNIAAHSYDENLEGNCEAVATGVYVPNGMSSASNAFSRGDYDNTVIGVVTDGTLTVGIKCLDGTIDGRWPLWDNFRLKYLGKSVEVLKDVLPDLIAQLEDYVANNEGTITEPGVAEAEAVVKTAEAAIEDEDGDQMLAAITAVNDALAAAKANVAAVEALQKAIETLDETAQEYYETASVEAQQKYNEVSAKTENYSELTTAEVEALTDEINAAISALKVPAEEASDENPVDYTALIINSTFDTVGDFTGWSSGFGAGGTTSTNAECYNKNFDVYQDIAGLPAGTYKVACYGYYRQGSAENDYNNTQTEDGTPAYNTVLYAVGEGAESSAPIMSICAGMVSAGLGGDTSSVGSGNVVPNTMAAATNWFEAGYYAPTDEYNSVIVKVGEDGKLRIGVKKDVTISSDWAIFDNFTLTYYGANSSKEPTGGVSIASVAPAATAAPAAIYTITGAKVATLQKGINIVKGADGSVRKVLVK